MRYYGFLLSTVVGALEFGMSIVELRMIRTENQITSKKSEYQTDPFLALAALYILYYGTSFRLLMQQGPEKGVGKGVRLFTWFIYPAFNFILAGVRMLTASAFGDDWLPE